MTRPFPLYSALSQHIASLPSTPPTGPPMPQEAEGRAENIENLIDFVHKSRWRAFFAEASVSTYHWAADLEGLILFSEGGGYPVNHFQGKHLYRDFGNNQSIREAIEEIQRADRPDELLQFVASNMDQDQFSNKCFLNVYTLLRTTSGRPYAVAVTSTDLTTATGAETCNSLWRPKGT